MDLHLDFTGKTAIVTGAASGIGFCTAKAFAESGARTAMLDINGEVLSEKAKEISGEVLPLAVDVTDREAVEKAVKTVYDTYGRIDFLVNCAGGYARRMKKVPGDTDLLDVPMEVFEWGIALNLMGPIYMTFSALRYMKETGGCVVNLGSVTGYEGSRDGIDYPVSKSALMGGFTKSIAEYGAPYGIRCCCVSPGPIMTRKGMASMTTLLRRPGMPEDIMHMILYLCSDYGNFITGTNYFVDGGRILLDDKTRGGNTAYQPEGR